MARPRKDGMDYFSLDVDFFSDKKIKILKARYGADGITIYLYLLCEIYKSGYYLKMDDDFEFILSDDLNMNCDKVKQVLTFLLERSLFDNKLFQSDAVLTSAGIQRRFQLMVKSRATKNPINVGRYWLLQEEETETFIKVRHSKDNSDNNISFSENNPHKSGNKCTKESKVKESKGKENIKGGYFENLELDNAFRLYITGRIGRGDKLSAEQIQVLQEELTNLSDNDAERIAIAKKAFASGWKSFYPINNKKSSKPKKDLNNFERRRYDMGSLEQQLLESQKGDM